MKWIIPSIAIIFFNNANASNYLGFNLCDSFDSKFEEARLSKENYKIKLERNIDKRYSTYWVDYYTIVEGVSFSLRLGVFDGKLLKINLLDTMGGPSHVYETEYFSRMKIKYGPPKFLRKTQNKLAIDTWDVEYKYHTNDNQVDILVGDSTWKSTANLYGFVFSNNGGVNYIEYVCKDLNKVYVEYKKNNEPINKKPDVKF